VSPATALQLAPSQIVSQLIEDLGLEHRDLRVIFDIEQRSLDKWISGEVLPQKAARRRLNELHHLQGHLGETFNSWEGARAWLRSPSRYLAGLTPLQALRAGDIEHASSVERVEEALEALDAGVFL
jgi:hypothetical protein